MGLCKYAYYKEDEVYYPRLYCKYDNGYCIGSKRCNQVEKFIPLDNYNEKECYKYVMQEQKNIPKGSYYVQLVRPNKKGFLYVYVVIGEKVEKILTDLTHIEQTYIYIKKDSDGYKVSLTPFPIEVEKEKKTYYNKKSKVKVKDNEQK